jgi:glycoside/pentoside/hexuronide:cation symporter, GPH family
MAEAAPEDELTSLRTKLFYGFGSVAFGVKDNGFQTILLLFYNQVVHLPGLLIGLALSIALIIDAFVDPIVGHFSDNLRTRWGRRHPLMYGAALPVAIGYLLLWNPPHWSLPAMFAYLVVAAIFVRTLITFYEIPSSALVPELTQDYDQRTSFLGYRLFFAWYGGMTMYALAFLVFLTPDKTHSVGQLNQTGYSHYGITASIVMFLAIVISAAGTHKFIPLLRVPEERRGTLADYFREILSIMNNRAFLNLMLAGIIFYFATGLVFALNIYLLTYLWQFSNLQIFALSLSTFIAVFLGFVVAIPVSKRFGKRDAGVWMFVIGLAISIVPLGLRLMGLFLPNGSPLLVPTLFVFNVVYSTLTIGAGIPMISMLADVVEESELRTGKRSEGVFFAGSSFMQKTASGLGLLGSGAILWLSGFPTHAVPGRVDPAVIQKFGVIYLVTVVVLYCIAAYILRQFPITRESHEANLRRLAGEAAPLVINDAIAPRG